MWWLSPISWMLSALLLIGIGLCKARLRGPLITLALALVAFSLAAMTPLFANQFLRLVEPDVQDADCAGALPDTAVVMAGGVDSRPADAEDISVLSLASRRRTERAVLWWEEKPGRKLFISGGTLFSGSAAESRIMAEYARRLGVPVADIEIEDQSTTTWEGAKFLARRSPPIPGRVVLITSAVHMRRASYAMTMAGFDVCKLATDSRVAAFGLPGYVIPQTSAIAKTESAMHEVVGLAYYRWLAFSDNRLQAARAANNQ